MYFEVVGRIQSDVDILVHAINDECAEYITSLNYLVRRVIYSVSILSNRTRIKCFVREIFLISFKRISRSMCLPFKRSCMTKA